MKLIPLALAACLVSSIAHADFITGLVVDSNGQPVAGVNIAAKSQAGGGDGHLANAGTDANGFFNATIDPGTYRLTFEPPPPPAALGLVKRVDDVVVSGSTSLGTVTLDPAVVLSGRAVRSGSIPVFGVNLDVIDLANGDNIDLVGDLTNTLGEFQIAVPIGQIELRLDTSPIFTPLLAPTRQTISTTADVVLGDIPLAPGFKVSAAVVNSSFQGVQDLDVDVLDFATGEELYTPGDNTDTNGFVDFVVPAGVFDMEFCPQPTDNLVAHLTSSVTIAATTNLGIITLANGVRLTGNVTSYLGTPAHGVDIDVRNAATQTAILLCNDNTNAAGNYSVVIPTGTFDVTFSPPLGTELGSRIYTDVSVAGNTVRNAVLPFCGCSPPVGTGVAGTGGFIPTITATGGAPRLGNVNWGFDVGQGRGGAFGVAAFGFGATCGAGLRPTFTPMGQLGLVSQVQISLFHLDGANGAAGAGSAHVNFPIPNDFALVGLTLSVRANIFDPAALGGRAKTPVLCGALCQ